MPWPSLILLVLLGGLAAAHAALVEDRSGKPEPAVEAGATIQPLNGAPAMFHQGVPLLPMAFTDHGEPTPEFYRDLFDGGMETWVVIYYPADDSGNVDLPDFRGLDGRLAEILQTRPEAKILLETHLRVEPTWGKRYPDELYRRAGAEPGPTEYSFASRVWLEEMSSILRSMVRHVNAAPYASHIVGYLLGTGATDESGHFGWGIDTSPPMTAYFREWLREKYRGDEAALRRTWHNPQAAFETATVPAPEEEATTGYGAFRDPRVAQRLLDYYQAHNEVIADRLIRLARVVKEASARPALVGYYYANLTTVHYVYSGHQAVRKVLAAPEIDFLCSPPPYENRGLGDEAPFRSVTDSFKLRHKVWFSQMDTRTFLRRKSREQFPAGEASEPVEAGTPDPYGRPDTREETLELLKRDFSNVLVHSAMGFWFSGSPFFNDPAIVSLFAQMQQIGRFALRLARRSAAEIAVFIDEPSCFVAPQEVTFNLLHRERIHELGRVGAPYDIYLLDDLARPDFPEYKLYVFLNAFSLPAAQRRAIDEKVKRDGKVALWFYAPGIIHPEATPTASPAHARKLIGLNLRVERGSYPLEMEWQSAGPLPPHPPRMRGGARGGVAVEKGTRLGNFARMITTGFDVRPPDFPPLTPPPCVGDPRVVVEDPQAEPLATYTDGGGVGFALRRFPHWTSIFYGSQALPAGVLRSIAAYAGVHVYNSQDDVLYANRHFLALHTREGGRREIALPGRVEVIYDLFGQRVVARHVDRFHLQLAPFSTTLLYCGDEAGFEPR